MARGTGALWALLLAAALLAPLTVLGQSYRYGTVSWQQLSGVGTGRTVRFTIRTAWQSSAFGGNVALGSNQTEATQFFPSTVLTDRFGFSMSVTFVSSAGTWFLGEQTVTYAYTVDGLYTAYFERCCRFSGLINNANLNFRLETQLGVYQGSSRQSASVTIAPIVTATINSPLTYTISASSPNGNTLRYQLAETVARVNVVGTTSVASFTPISGLSVNSVTGTFTWTPSIAGMYQQQIYVDEVNSANVVVGRTAVDFLFSVIAASSMRCKAFCANRGDPCANSDTCSNCFDPFPIIGAAPLCDINFAPTFTSITIGGVTTNNPSGTLSTSVIVDSSITIVVRASDADVEDRVTITSTTLTGATLTTVSANPGTLTIVYTLDRAAGSPIVCFTATDSVGQQSSSQLCVLITPTAPTMTVSGTAVTTPAAGIWGFSVLSAGEPASFNITHDDAKVIQVQITGVSATSVTASKIATLSSGKAVYAASYNSPSAISTAGSYTVTITETTPSVTVRSAPIVQALQVYATTTSGANALIFDQGTTGLVGGFKSGSVAFFVQSRDRFNNKVEVDRSATERYSVAISYAGGPTVETNSTFDADTFLYRLQYTVPNTPEGTDEYTLQVYFIRNNVRTLVFTDTLDIILTGNNIVVEGLADRYYAGDPISFRINASTSSEVFTVTIAGNAATVVNNLDKSYSVSLPGGVTVAKFYSDLEGVVIVAPGLSAELVDGTPQWNQGIRIYPNRAFGPNCEVRGSGIGSAIAGETSLVEIIPYDRYGNRVIPYELTGDDQKVTYPVFEEKIYWKAVHEDLSILELEGQATYRSSTDLYFFEYEFETAGFFTLTIVLNATGVDDETVKDSPYRSSITAADVSVTASAIASPTVVTVGEFAGVSVTALDVYFNKREPMADTFEAFVEDLNVTLDVVESATINDYFASYTTTKSGIYEIGFRVFSALQGGFINFPTRSIYFEAGEIDPTKNQYSGRGLTGGQAGTTQQLLIQCRDRFENVVEKRGGINVIVQVVSVTERTQVYLSSYREKIGCGSATTSASYRFKTLDNDNGENTITTEEQAWQGEGYFELAYKVPRLGSKTSVQFTINVYNVNDSILNATGYDPELVNLDELVVSNSLTATATRNAALTAVTDEWYVVAAIVLASLMGLSIALYAVWRMVRYREKYHEEKVVADELQKQVRDMADEQDLIPGQRDYEAIGEATVTLNPLHAAYRNSIKTVPKEGVDDAEIEMDVERSPLRQEFKPQLPAGAASSLD